MVDNNIVFTDFHETQKCPTGDYALLPGKGLCRVISAAGFDRVVSYREDADDPTSEVTKRVCVRTLRHLDPWRDLLAEPGGAGELEEWGG